AADFQGHVHYFKFDTINGGECPLIKSFRFHEIPQQADLEVINLSRIRNLVSAKADVPRTPSSSKSNLNEEVRSISENNSSSPVPPNDKSEETSSTPNEAAEASMTSKTGSNDENPKSSQAIMTQSTSEEKNQKELDESSTDSSSSSEEEEEGEEDDDDDDDEEEEEETESEDEAEESETSTSSSSSSEKVEERIESCPGLRSVLTGLKPLKIVSREERAYTIASSEEVQVLMVILTIHLGSKKC
ncbi:unnamed protein product, partial [Hymenolepis diminuta]